MLQAGTIQQHDATNLLGYAITGISPAKKKCRKDDDVAQPGGDVREKAEPDGNVEATLADTKPDEPSGMKPAEDDVSNSKAPRPAFSTLCLYIYTHADMTLTCYGTTALFT